MTYFGLIFFCTDQRPWRNLAKDPIPQQELEKVSKSEQGFGINIVYEMPLQ